MSGSARTVDSFRHVIPRWRPTRDVRGSIESTHPGSPQWPQDIVDKEFSERVIEYRDDPNPVTETELLSTAVVLGREDDVADLAREILSRGPDGRKAGALTLAKAVLQPAATESGFGLYEPVRETAHARIRLLKNVLRRDPRNSLACLDLALAYTTLGQTSQAKQYIDRSLVLAPDHRLILRASCRFYVHLGEPDTAHGILARSARSQTDPWLAGTLVSTAMLAGKRLPRRKTLDSLIESSSPQHATELLSAVGTAHLRDGADRPAIRRLRASLERPTENTLAQAEWVGHRAPLLEVHPDLLDGVPLAFEATARHLEHEDDPYTALEQAELWADFQPFSGEAGAYASYIASVGLADFSRAAKVLEGLVASGSRDPYVVNNYAFAMANLDKIDRAREVLTRVRDKLENSPHLLATSGLIAYRSGDADSGYALYSAALRMARRTESPSTLPLMAMFWLREAARVGRAVDVLHEVEPFIGQSQHPYVRMWRQRLMTETALASIHSLRESPSSKASEPPRRS